MRTIFLKIHVLIVDQTCEKLYPSILIIFVSLHIESVARHYRGIYLLWHGCDMLGRGGQNEGDPKRPPSERGKGLLKVH